MPGRRDEGWQSRSAVRRLRTVVGKVEAQALGLHDGPLLLHVLAQHLSQRKVEHVGEGVVGHDAVASGHVHLCGHRIADGQRRPGGAAHMQNVAGCHLRIVHRKAAARGPHHARVRHLTARLGIKGGPLQNKADRAIAGLCSALDEAG